VIRQRPKKIEFPKDLPVSSRHDEILEAIKNNQVTIISGETGSGKTTQIPKICLELGLGQKKNHWPYSAKTNCGTISG